MQIYVAQALLSIMKDIVCIGSKGLKFIAFIAWNNHSGSPYGQSDSRLLQFGYQSVFFENLIAAI
jgi:hypothetical protein